MKTRFRGSGFKHTLSAVFPFSAVWVFVVVLTVPILLIGMMAGDLVPESSYSDVWFFLATRMPVLALAAIALAIFTTSRVAGPLIPIRRAFVAVKGGDMDHRLSLRRSDRHLKNLEQAFGEMMVALLERTESRVDREAEEERTGD